MQHRTETSGALAPPTHRHRMLISTAQWRASSHLRHSAFFGQLRDLALLRLCPAARSQPSKQQAPAFCSASALHRTCSTWSQHRPAGLAPGSIASKQSASSPPAAAAAAAARLGGSSQVPRRGLCTSSAPGLEPASFSGQHGLRRSVRLQAVPERGHCGEDGLVKGAGVIFPENTGLKLQRRAYIVWDEGGPRSALLVKKSGDRAAAAMLEEIGKWLQARGLKVLVERGVRQKEFPQFEEFTPNSSDVDFCVTLGGDGTVLHLTSLFTEDVPLPPLVSFAMGTLGFLTPFDVAQYQSCLTQVLEAAEMPVFCTLRTRKRCELTGPEGSVQATHHVLNECLIDRGSSPSMVRTELFVDGHHITTVQADGLIIATPSGSTAYSMSAGGPMVAPSVPCTLLTPIAPHSLSFRPLVVPEASDVEIHIPFDSRANARVSFDGRNTCRMARGSIVKCTTSLCAVPFINLGPLDNDWHINMIYSLSRSQIVWYDGIVQKLKWNVSARELRKLPSLKKPHYEENGASWDSCPID